jgi:hypothetical protein
MNTLLLAAGLWLQSLPTGERIVVHPTSSDIGSFVVDTSAPAFLMFGDGDKEILRITREGHVVFAPGITPDAATKKFVELLRDNWPCPVK